VIRALLIALLASGCTYELGNRVEPIVADGYDASIAAEWRDLVAEAGAIWRDALGCADPFPSDGDGPTLPVTLYPPATWPGGPGRVGLAAADDVIVKGPVPGEPMGLMIDILLHELGHIMHLGHNLGDPTSVMYVPVRQVTWPNARDIELARAMVCP